MCSLNVSIKAFGADKDGDNQNRKLASLQYEEEKRKFPTLLNIDKARTILEVNNL